MHSSAFRQPTSELVGTGSERAIAADAVRNRGAVVGCVSGIHAPNGGYLTETAPSGGLPNTTAFGRGWLFPKLGNGRRHVPFFFFGWQTWLELAT